MKHRIELWKNMVTTANPKAQDYLMQITAEAKAEGKIDQMAEAAAFLMEQASDGMSRVEESISEYRLIESMGNLPEAINLAYIARHYFGKTRQWLYQRVKGQIVNGRQASFTPTERATFVGALNDIGIQIASFTSRAL